MVKVAQALGGLVAYLLLARMRNSVADLTRSAGVGEAPAPSLGQL